MFVTECCKVSDTFWDDLHVCRKCHKPNPTMIEVEDDDRYTLADKRREEAEFFLSAMYQSADPLK